jgi:uncharacterized membrane protein
LEKRSEEKMDLMALILLFAFAAIFSIAFNYAAPKVASVPQLQSYTGTYFGRTAITTVTVFVLLIVVSFAMSFVASKPKLPSA